MNKNVFKLTHTKYCIMEKNNVINIYLSHKSGSENKADDGLKVRARVLSWWLHNADHLRFLSPYLTALVGHNNDAKNKKINVTFVAMTL